MKTIRHTYIWVLLIAGATASACSSDASFLGNNSQSHGKKNGAQSSGPSTKDGDTRAQGEQQTSGQPEDHNNSSASGKSSNEDRVEQQSDQSPNSGSGSESGTTKDGQSADAKLGSKSTELESDTSELKTCSLDSMAIVYPFVCNGTCLLVEGAVATGVAVVHIPENATKINLRLSGVFYHGLGGFLAMNDNVVHKDPLGVLPHKFTASMDYLEDPAWAFSWGVALINIDNIPPVQHKTITLPAKAGRNEFKGAVVINDKTSAGVGFWVKGSYEAPTCPSVTYTSGEIKY